MARRISCWVTSTRSREHKRVRHSCHIDLKMTALFTLPRANLFSNTETGSKKQLNENLKKKKRKKRKAKAELLDRLVMLQMPKARINWLIRHRPSVRCLIIKRTSQDVFQKVNNSQSLGRVFLHRNEPADRGSGSAVQLCSLWSWLSGMDCRRLNKTRLLFVQSI